MIEEKNPHDVHPKMCALENTQVFTEIVAPQS